MTHRVIVLVTLVFLLIASAAMAQNQPGGAVAGIEIDGNRRVESDAILRVIETQVGDPYSPERVSEDLKKIYQLGYFDDVQVEVVGGAGGRVVRFLVKEKPAVAMVEFYGNQIIDDEDLAEVVNYPLYAILDPRKVQEGMGAVREAYREKGYYNVKVTYETLPLEDKQVNLRYTIEEGSRMYITRIEFIGNEAYDDDDLADLMETETKGLLSFIMDKGVLKDEMVREDVQRITDFYHNNGYIQARVGQPEVISEEDGLALVFRVQEGPRFKVGKISVASVRGPLIKPEEEILAELKLTDKEIFSLERLENDIRTVRQIYADRGYAFAEVNRQFIEQPDHVLDVALTVERKKKVTFERISISGNTHTRDHVIRRELKIKEGDLFSVENLRESNLNLHRLGYFEDVEIIHSQGSEDDLMNIAVRVKERDTGSFSVGAGYSSYNKLFGTIKIAEANLFGTGRKLRLEATIGSVADEYNLSFVEPWLFDIPLNMRTSLYRRTNEYTFYDVESYGFLFGMSYPVWDKVFVGADYQLELLDVSDISPNSTQAIRDLEGESVSSALSAFISRDTRNAMFNPTEGSINSFSATYNGGPFGGDYDFTKFVGQSGWHIPSGFEDWTFFVRGKLGYLVENGEGGAPIHEKFHLGGLNSLRGFKFNTVSPTDPITGERIGGEKMALFNVELVFPIFKDSGFMGVVFYDVGNAWTKEQSWFDDMRMSYGGGVRFFSPIGPLRFEYGRIIDPRFGEPTDNFEFSMGTLF